MQERAGQGNTTRGTLGVNIDRPEDALTIKRLVKFLYRPASKEKKQCHF
jgi:hypothetical protein